MKAATASENSQRTRRLSTSHDRTIIARLGDGLARWVASIYPSADKRNQAESPVLKKYPQDFLVCESMLLPRVIGTGGARFSYLKLTKSGFSTFDAVEQIAHYFQLSQDKIHFGGLKDEDAITEQMIAIEGSISEVSIEGFNHEHLLTPQEFLDLRYQGAGNEQIRIGQLNGNNFRIVVRNLSRQFAERLCYSQRYILHFLNYYDIQRFGTPNSLKTTHLVGEAILRNDYEKALGLLRKMGTPEGQRALAFNADAEGFFANLNPRLISFFKSSYSSHLWNGELAALVRQICGHEAYEEVNEGIPFFLTRKQNLILSVLKRQKEIEHTKYYNDANGRNKFQAPRATVIQTQIFCNGIEPDELHNDAYRCEFSFFLPSGCYATMCVRQFVNMVDLIC